MSVQPDRRVTPWTPPVPVIVAVVVISFFAAFLALYPTAALLVLVAAMLATWRLVANHSSKS